MRQRKGIAERHGHGIYSTDSLANGTCGDVSRPTSHLSCFAGLALPNRLIPPFSHCQGGFRGITAPNWIVPQTDEHSRPTADCSGRTH